MNYRILKAVGIIFLVIDFMYLIIGFTLLSSTPILNDCNRLLFDLCLLLILGMLTAVYEYRLVRKINPPYVGSVAQNVKKFIKSMFTIAVLFFLTYNNLSIFRGYYKKSLVIDECENYCNTLTPYCQFILFSILLNLIKTIFFSIILLMVC